MLRLSFIEGELLRWDLIEISDDEAQHIEDKIQAAGTVDGINLASATCVVKTSLDFA